MLKEEQAYYTSLYKVINDPVINELLVKYAKMKYDNAIKNMRSKKELYDYAYNNGIADAFQDLINLKTTVMGILRNV